MSKFIKTFSIGLVAVAMAVSVASTGSAQTADLQAQIASLLAQIAALQAQLGASQAPAVQTYNFTRGLTIGSKGEDVTALQTYLESQGYLTMPTGVSKGYFGSLTKAAVAKWQSANGVSPAAGYFGSISRSKYASLAAAMPTPTPTTPTPITPTTPTTPTGEGLAITLASDNPVSAVLGSGTAFNKALKVSFTASADTKITAITVTKSGFLANTRLNGVDVVDSSGARHGNVVTSINADNTVLITMTADPIVVSAGKTETATIRFNLTTGSYTGTVSFNIASASGITSNASAVNGTFPISGNAMSVVDGSTSLASTTLEALSTTGTSTLNIDAASAQEMTRFRVKELSSNEAIKLYSMTLYNNGNAADGDVKDVQLIDQDGTTVLATAQQVGKYVKLVLDTPKEIAKGATRDFIIKTKIVNGASRTIQYVVYESYDIDLRGVTTGVSLVPTAGSGQSFPIGKIGNTQTVGSGSITFSRASDSPSKSVTPGSSDVVLAKYTAKPAGENMELRKVNFYIATSTNPVVLTGSVTIEVNGSTVYSTAASNIGTGSNQATAVTLTSYPILTAGVESTIIIKGSVNTTATSSSSYQVKSFDITEVKRIVTNDLVDPGVSATDGNVIAVNAAALTVRTLVTPIAQSVVAGTNGFEFATLELDAQSGGEDVKVSRIVVTQTNSSTTPATYITGFALYKDSDTSPLATTASTASLSSNAVTFSLSSPITVSRTTNVKLHLKANISTTVPNNATSTFKVNAAGDTTATGAATGNTVSPTVSGTGQIMTLVTSGVLSVINISELGVTPPVSNQVVNIGTTARTFYAARFTSSYETQKITTLVLTATSSALNQLSTTTLTNVSLYEGTTLRQTKPFLCTGDSNSTWCTVTFTATDNILSAPVPTAGVTLYVKADVATPIDGVRLGDNFKFQITSSTSDIIAAGSVTNQAPTVTMANTPLVTDGLTYVVPQNVKIEAVAPTTQVGLTAGQTVAIFKVTNNGTAPIYFSTSTNPTFANSGSATSSVQTSAWELWASNMGASATKDTTYGTSTSGTSLSSSTVAFGSMNAITEADRKINGTSYRYLIIETNIAAENNNTFSLSVSALGNLRFYVKEGELGYDANGDADTSDTITTGMYVDGITAPTNVTSKT